MRVLITGGTGSLGHALTAHWLKTTDWRIVIFSRDEWKQAVMRDVFPTPRVDFFLGDVRDEQRLRMAFEGEIDVVIHAAALKRVDKVAYDPDEVIKTNVDGTRNVLHAARGHVTRVLLISSDKACYATNAYGKSKALAEDLATGYNVYGYPAGTLSSVVRYGNVLGSRGSVVPLWREQMKTGVITLTDPLMTRFLITFPQAVRVIDEALDRMGGGEIFVPDLPAATMGDLAKAVAPGIQRRITGKRPGGEKDHEVLLTLEEAERACWPVKGITTIPPHLHPWRSDDPWQGAGLPKAMVQAVRSDTAERLNVDEITALLEEANV